jgi:hypothetical protein
MPLKIYSAYESRDSVVPVAASEVIGDARHQNQAPYFVVAPSKVAATEYLRAAQIYDRGLRLSMGNGLHALMDAGLLSEEGTVIVASMNHGGVARFVNGVWTYIGEIEHPKHTRGQATFIPATETEQEN